MPKETRDALIDQAVIADIFTLSLQVCAALRQIIHLAK